MKHSVCVFPKGPWHEGGGRAASKRPVTFLHGLVNQAFQLLGLVVLGLSLQQSSHILQSLFIFLQSEERHTSNGTLETQDAPPATPIQGCPSPAQLIFAPPPPITAPPHRVEFTNSPAVGG